MTQKANSFYWIIISLLLIATSLSFLDRQVLSISILEIKKSLHVSDVDYGFINSGFLISYAIMFTLGGILIDRYGSRLGLGLSVGFWSFATLLHSLATNVFHFGFFRFLLGLGEGGCFPGAIKAVIEWVPGNKRALANGIAIGGAALGAVIAPPLCVYLLGTIGWRGVFVVTGGFGFVWLMFWLLFTRKKQQNSIQTLVESKEDIDENPGVRVKLPALLKNKEVLVFVVIRFVLDPIFYLYMFWVPKFLNEAHSVPLEVIGNLLWIPFLALGIAHALGGWISDSVFVRTSNLNLARKLVMGVAAALTIPLVFVGFIHSHILIIVLMSLAFFAHGLWMTNYITSIGDIFGKTVTSTVVGLSGSAGALSSMVLNPLIGYVVASYSYRPIWWYAGLMYPAAFIYFLLLIPRIELKKIGMTFQKG